MGNIKPIRSHVVAVLVALAAALVARAVLQLELREVGLQRQFAADLSYLLVPSLLAVLLVPVFKAHRRRLRECIKTSHLNARLVINALALGLLLRLTWWCHIIVGVSLGIYHNDDPDLVSGPEFVFRCPPGHALATGVLVMSILVPITEEIIHRGFVQSYLRTHGPTLAIAGSAAVFMVFHPLGTWGFVFIAGLVFGAQYWIARSLWPSLLTHATINTLVIVDWRCMQGRWNPSPTDLPRTSVAVIATGLLMACGVSIILLLFKMHRGERSPR